MSEKQDALNAPLVAPIESVLERVHSLSRDNWLQ